MMIKHGHSLSTKTIKKAENVDLPLLALRAISELREAMDDLEMAHIESAREKGDSWEDIAEALGITRQALQQRMKARKNGHSEIRLPD